MGKGIAAIFLSMLAFMCAHATPSVDALLSDWAQKADLSEKTKQESVGHLSVYTRQDLDQMQIRSLKELIDYVPYIRYNEDANGQSSPFYSAYQPNRAALLRVYLNDRELFNPYFGNSVQLFGQISLGYVDHIEIYSGIPSYKFGIEGSMTVIRLYTKDPQRENTNLVGVMAGTYGASDMYGYSAQAFDDFSYLLHVSSRNIDRKTLSHNGYDLSRDQENTNIYSQFDVGNHHFSLHALKMETDNFIGESWGIEPLQNTLSNDYVSGGWSYTSGDESWKASLDFMQSKTKKYQLANDAIGIIPTSIIGSTGAPLFLPIFATYSEHKLDVTEQMADLHLSKTWTDKQNSLLVGLRGRYKKFEINTFEVDGVSLPVSSAYDMDFITSLYAEGTHLIDDKNMLIASLKYDDYYRNGDINDAQMLGGRLGYIYNQDKWFLKSFFFFGEIAPDPYLVSAAKRMTPTQDLSLERAWSLSAELGYKHTNAQTSLTLGRSVYKDSIFFTGTQYENLDDIFTYDTALLKNSYHFDTLNRIDTNLWLTHVTNENAGFPKYTTTLGGYVTLFNSLGKWNIANSVRFYGLDYHPSYNYNIAVTYKHNRQLSFFVKGTNLLGDALTTDYVRVAQNFPYTQTRIEDVDVYDRTLLFGVEYQF